MIYPAQTSLIPIQVALARFLESLGGLGINAFNQNYPYWYLGTTPFRYLTGPILVPLLALIHRLLPSYSLFEIMFGVIAVCWVVGGIGVYLLVRGMRGNEGLGGLMRADFVALISAFFYLFGSIVPFLFRFSDGLYLMTFSFLPFILLLQHRVQRENKNHRDEVLLCLLIAFVILLDSLIIPSLLLGMTAIFLAQVGWKRAEVKLRQTFLIFAFSFLISSLWYTPGYWWTLLGAPSFGGKGLVLVVVWLGKLLPVALALTAAVFSVKFFKKRDPLRDFCFYWLFIFGFLTLVRFLSDPDFWLDWTSYGVEMQMGIAIAFGLVINQISNIKYQNDRLKFKNSCLAGRQVCILLCSFAFYILIFAFIANKYVLGTLQPDITQTVEYRIGKQLSEIANPQEKVFLSGTTAFWLNAFFDIPQVRGGRDQVSVDQNWRQGVWEIRDGSAGSPQGVDKSVEWLKKLGVSYLVVHTKHSKEFYHDFVYPEKFETISGLKKIYSDKGDRIYQVIP